MTARGALELASELLAGRLGLRVEGAMRDRVARAFGDLAEARGETPARFARTLRSDPESLERLVDAVTVPESGFFRDPQHFDVLVRCALPELGGQGVIWSAGCANGQEAWSLAIALEECGAAGWRVLATDVSRRALARTRAGRYEERELGGLSAARRAQFLRPAGDGCWEVGPRLRRRVHVTRHNLAEEPAPAEAGACRVVFCRNVLIYFDVETRMRALAALRDRLPADGWLFLGAAETLAAGARFFSAQRTRGTFAYRPRRGRPAARRAPRDSPPAAAAPPPAGVLPDPAALVAEGEAHAAAGRTEEARTAFRKAAFLSPNDPVALLGLGLALEPDDRTAAARTFRAARAALARGGGAARHGWSEEAVARLLDAKLGDRD